MSFILLLPPALAWLPHPIPPPPASRPPPALILRGSRPLSPSTSKDFYISRMSSTQYTYNVYIKN